MPCESRKGRCILRLYRMGSRASRFGVRTTENNRKAKFYTLTARAVQPPTPSSHSLKRPLEGRHRLLRALEQGA